MLPDCGSAKMLISAKSIMTNFIHKEHIYTIFDLMSVCHALSQERVERLSKTIQVFGGWNIFWTGKENCWQMFINVTICIKRGVSALYRERQYYELINIYRCFCECLFRLDSRQTRLRSGGDNSSCPQIY